jgi:hypothetical protein
LERKEIFQRDELVTWRIFIVNNGAMDKAQKIKNGILLALAVASLVLFVLWLTDVIGIGLVTIFIVVLTAASVGVRVWAENAGRQSK